MFTKRKFIKTFIREENGEKLYFITDEGDEVFIDRLFNERNAEAVLNLVTQSYERGVLDIKEHIEKATKISKN